MKKTIIGALLVSTALLCSASAVLLFTATGLRIGVRCADLMLPGDFSVEDVQGRLGSRFILENVQYGDQSLEISLQRFSFSWVPGALLQKKLAVRFLGLENLMVTQKESVQEPRPDGQTELPSFSLPIALSLRKGELNSLVFRSGADEEPVRVEQITVQDLSGTGEILRFAEVGFANDTLRFAAGGEIRTGKPYTARLDVSYALDLDGYSPISGNGVAEGSLAELAFRTDLASPFTGILEGTARNLFEAPAWEGTLTAESVSIAGINPSWPQIELSGPEITGRGARTDYTLQVTSRVAYEPVPAFDLTGELDGDADGMLLSDVEIIRQGQKIKGRGKLAWQEGFTWSGSFSSDELAASLFDRSWPDLVFNDLQFSGSGKNDSYSFMIIADTRYESFSDIHFTADAAGDATGLRIQAAEMRHRGGILTGRGSLGWREGFSWQADVSGRGFDPVILDERFPGSLDVQFSSTGQMLEESIHAAVHLDMLTGQLRGYDVAAQGDIEVAENDIIIEQFLARSSDSVLDISGRLADVYDFDFSLKSPDLAALWPNATGSLQAQGQIAGTRKEPRIRFESTAADLEVGNLGIRSLNGFGQGDVTREGGLEVSMHAEEVTIGDSLLQAVDLELQGTLEDHRLDLEVDAPTGQGKMSLAGGYDGERWTGKISSGDMQTEQWAEWQIRGPVQVSVAPEEITVADLCLAGVDEALLCAEGVFAKGEAWRIRGRIEDLPADFFQNLHVRFRDMEGALNGTLNAHGDESGVEEARADLFIDNLTMPLDLEQRDIRRVAWQKNNIMVVFREKNADIRIESILRDGSAFRAKGELSDIALAPFSVEETAVEGDLQFDDVDLVLLAAFFPTGIEPTGVLQGTLNFSGRLLQPEVNGTIALKEGDISIPETGITVSDVRVKVKGIGKKLEMQFTAASGEGTLQADGHYSFSPDELYLARFHVTGNEFQVFNSAEAIIHVSPDLMVKLSPEQVALTGEIRLDEALLNSYDRRSRIKPTGDVVFVDGGEKERKEELPLYIDITVTAGEKVKVDAYGLKAALDGKLRLMHSPGKQATGEGKLEVLRGYFSVYGRQLEIKTGRLIYSGNPLDNPGISVRAEKTTAEGITTGIEVGGFLQEPNISFYSTPSMAQDEIIRRLLVDTSLVGSKEEEGFMESLAAETGLDPVAATVRDVKESLGIDEIKLETGETSEEFSLVLGTWITPRLYVSYGQSLLNESGTFNTRYLLDYGFSLETESGVTQSGVDLKYEIEK